MGSPKVYNHRNTQKNGYPLTICSHKNRIIGYEPRIEVEKSPDFVYSPWLKEEQLALQQAYAKRDFAKIAKAIRKHMTSRNNQEQTKDIQVRQLETATSVVPYGYETRETSLNQDKILVYFHGGGLIGGSNRTVEPLLKWLAHMQNKYFIIGVDYEVMPEKSASEIVENVAEYLEELLNEGKTIVVCGDSSGGYLAASMGQRYGADLAGQILIYPQISFEVNQWVPSIHFYNSLEEEREKLVADLNGMHQFMQLTAHLVEQLEGSEANVNLSLQHHLTGVKNSPPTLFLMAEYDGLILHGWNYYQQLLDAHKEAKYIVYQGTQHAFVDYFGLMPQAYNLGQDIIDWIEELTTDD